MNFCRGTGIHGLTGIPVKNNYIRRPLLEISKQDLQQYAKENHLGFVEDSSNQSLKYTRNFFRNEIIPAIKTVLPTLKENLSDSILRYKEIEKLYRVATNDLINKLAKKKANELHIPVKQLMGYNNKALIYEIISPYGFSEKQVEEVIKLSESDSGKFIENGQYRIIRHRHWFIISPQQDALSEHMIIAEDTKTIQLPRGIISIDKLSLSKTSITQSKLVANLDLDLIEYPLLLRRWKEGDYFYPLGMKKKKKLSRFFIDQKLSKTEKEDIWLIEMNAKILWIVGHRIDERFKVTEKTKRILRLELTT
jgi:tRNA(Ile)-lysidine synthase